MRIRRLNSGSNNLLNQKQILLKPTIVSISAGIIFLIEIVVKKEMFEFVKILKTTNVKYEAIVAVLWYGSVSNKMMRLLAAPAP
jgi:hypothetical protein